MLVVHKIDTQKASWTVFLLELVLLAWEFAGSRVSKKLGLSVGFRASGFRVRVFSWPCGLDPRRQILTNLSPQNLKP